MSWLSLHRESPDSQREPGLFFIFVDFLPIALAACRVPRCSQVRAGHRSLRRDGPCPRKSAARCDARELSRSSSFARPHLHRSHTRCTPPLYGPEAPLRDDRKGMYSKYRSPHFFDSSIVHLGQVVRLSRRRPPFIYYRTNICTPGKESSPNLGNYGELRSWEAFG